MDYDSNCGLGPGPVALPRCHDPLGPCGLGACGPPWALVGQAFVGPLGPCGPPWALVGWAFAGPPGPLWARALWAPHVPLCPHGILHDGLSLVAPTIGHSPREDRRRHRNWIWLLLGQLHDDSRSVDIKGGIMEEYLKYARICMEHLRYS